MFQVTLPTLAKHMKPKFFLAFLDKFLPLPLLSKNDFMIEFGENYVKMTYTEKKIEKKIAEKCNAYLPYLVIFGLLPETCLYLF